MQPEPQALSTLAHALPQNCIFGLLCIFFVCLFFLQAQELHYWEKGDSAGLYRLSCLKTAKPYLTCILANCAELVPIKSIHADNHNKRMSWNNNPIQTTLIQLFVKTFVFLITNEKNNNCVLVSLS